MVRIPPLGTKYFWS